MSETTKIATADGGRVRLNGPFLRRCLRACGSNQRKLAGAIGIHEATVSRALDGLTQPSPVMVALIWHAFGRRLELTEIVNVPGLTPDDLPDVGPMPIDDVAAGFELDQAPAEATAAAPEAATDAQN
jgi:hypothetical protein